MIGINLTTKLGQTHMPSLTPLHETYCKWDRSPPSQADVLEGIAQLVSTRLTGVVRELVQTIQREVLASVFGLNKKKSQEFQKHPHIKRVYQFGFGALEK